MTVGDRIKFFRERAGLTQQQLADKVGVKFPAISKYELGTVDNLPLKKIEALADALGVTGAQLLGWEETPVDIVEFDASKSKFVGKRKKLHQIIDEAPDSVLSFIEFLLSLSPQQLELLSSLTARSRDETEL